MGFNRFAISCVVAGLAAMSVAGCGGSTTTTVIDSNGAAGTSHPARGASVSRPRSKHSGASASAPARPLIFHGTGQQDLGTITVPADTTISWNCPSCSSTNFIINNAQSDADSIPTNGLDQTQGVDPLSAGVYHTVVVGTTAGPWTVAIGASAPSPEGAGAAAAQTPDSSASSSSSIQGSFSQCDPNVSVTNGDCHFAENTFYEYWTHQGASSFSVYSPADQSSFTVSCTAGGEITCTTSQGATVQFSQSAIDAYTQSQADSYASSHKIGP